MVFFRKNSPKVVLVIMDGVGVAPPGPGNAVTLANTPNLDKYWQRYPHGVLKASGKYVGLPQDADGNSEVGHLTIGAGKVVLQDLPRIDNAIDSGSFYQNEQLVGAIEHAKKNNGAIHLVGLVGNGLVHSSLEHLFALIDLIDAKRPDPDKVYIHAILDGRDSSPDAGARVLKKIDTRLEAKRLGRIVSFIGRYYAKDRDQRWDRTKLAYELMTQAKGIRVNNYEEALDKYYKKGKSDEYVEPHVLNDFEGKTAKVQQGDAIINFDFRPDRAIQITQAFTSDSFEGFQRKKIDNLYYVGMTDYGSGFPPHVAFPREKVTKTLGQTLSTHRKSQIRIAESEKFPHVTYFFDGENEAQYEGVDEVEVPSNKKVGTYDKDPDMKCKEVARAYIDLDKKKGYDFALINFAPPDMVSHTGILEASVRAMEATDLAMGAVAEYALNKGALVLITSDHGNCEELVNPRTGEIDTKHSANDVPFIAVRGGLKKRELEYGSLADIAPTVLAQFVIEKPLEMEGQDLLSTAIA